MTPLMAAVMFGNTNVATALIECGADTEAKNARGCTVVTLARVFGVKGAMWSE